MLPDGCGLSVFFECVRSLCLCDFFPLTRKAEYLVFLFTACFTYLWFTNGVNMYVVEKTSGTSLFCLPFGSL